MFRAFARIIAPLLVCAMALPWLTGCGPRGRTIKVSSKEFTEQLLLGQIAILALEDAGYRVEDKTGIAGSNKLRSALLGKDIDLYWEYTGTGWLSHLQHSNPLADPRECYDKVRAEDARNGVAWLAYAPFNNTYTMMMRASQAQALGIHSLSQLGAYLGANPGQLSLAVDHEFTARPDGLPGLIATYGLKLKEDQVIVMDNAIVYKALKTGQADIGMGFSTDARIKAFGLVNIQDDKGFFPAYNPAPNLRSDFARDNPKIVELLARVAARLDNDTMMRLNYQVDIEQKVPKVVARAWMKDTGIIKG